MVSVGRTKSLLRCKRTIIEVAHGWTQCPYVCYTIFVGWEEKFPSHNEVSETRYGNRVVAEFPLRRNSSEMGYGVLGKRRDARPSPK